MIQHIPSNNPDNLAINISYWVYVRKIWQLLFIIGCSCNTLHNSFQHFIFRLQSKTLADLWSLPMSFHHVRVSKQCLYFYSVRVRTYNSFLKCDAQLSFYLVFLSFIVQYSTRVIIALLNIRFYIIQNFPGRMILTCTCRFVE